MTDALRQLMQSLPPGAVITDVQITGGYRRDRADLVAAGTPRAVIRPATVREVSITLAWASTHQVPVVPRGAGTGMSGGANAIDGCVVVSLEKMTAIREVNPQRQYAIAEAGVLNADLGRAAASAGMFYPPDPGSFEICTIGGNLATNAGGMRCVKYGVTRDCALALEVVLADGTPQTTARALAAGEQICARALELGGTITGEHGVGVLKQGWLRQQISPAALAVHQAIKAALDPGNILNPGRAF